MRKVNLCKYCLHEIMWVLSEFRRPLLKEFIPFSRIGRCSRDRRGEMPCFNNFVLFMQEHGRSKKSWWKTHYDDNLTVLQRIGR